MKKYFCVFLLVFGTVAISCNKKPGGDLTNQLENIDQEKTAIIESLRNETKAAFRRDYEAWKTYWVHHQKTSKTNMNFAENSFSEMNSWKEIDDFVRTYIEEHPKPAPLPAQPDGIDVRVYGTGAWVTFDIMDEEHGLKRETRLMEKEAGKWKIAGMHTSIYGFQKKD